VAFSHVLPVALTGSMDGKLVLWDNSSFTERAVCPHPQVGSILFEGHAPLSVPGVSDNSLGCPLQGVVKVACHQASPVTYSACLDALVRCWDLRTGTSADLFMSADLPCWLWCASQRVVSLSTLESAAFNCLVKDACTLRKWIMRPWQVSASRAGPVTQQASKHWPLAQTPTIS
jgi:WD40 repeat protein